MKIGSVKDGGGWYKDDKDNKIYKFRFYSEKEGKTTLELTESEFKELCKQIDNL